MVKKQCENCAFLGYFERDKRVFALEEIDYFCIIEGEFKKDLTDICECWVKKRDIIKQIVNKECDKLERIDEIIKTA